MAPGGEKCSSRPHINTDARRCVRRTVGAANEYPETRDGTAMVRRRWGSTRDGGKNDTRGPCTGVPDTPGNRGRRARRTKKNPLR